MDRPPPTPEQLKRNQRFVAGAAIFIGLTIVSSFFFRRCSPEAREAHEFLRTMPAESITQISVKPYAVSSLVKQEVIITKRADIERIASALRSAQPIGLNHPDARWVAIVRITTAHGDYGGQLESTTNQGVIMMYASNVEGGWNYGAVRNDDLGPLIEELVSVKSGD